MRILIYLYYPVYEDHLAGGVQVWIKDLIKYIENKYNDIKFQIICPDGDRFDFAKDIQIEHSLVDMERDFVSPKDIYENFQKIKKLEEQTDIIWMIDRNFPIQSNKPKLLSLNTLCYERELMSIFQSGWTKMVCLTDFVKNQIKDYIDTSNLYKIPCYVDPIFLNVDVNEEIIKKYFDYDKNKKYILFPHRPDLDKGHFEAIDILEELIKSNDSYRLLIPNPPLAKEINVEREQHNIDVVKEYVNKKKLNNYVIFHKWVDYSDIPYYYKIGEFTLFLSKLPETFGITLLNSVSVGTPVLSYGVGALNEVVPVGKSHFNFKTKEEATKIILSGKSNIDVESDIRYVKEKYNLNKIAEQYVELFRTIKENKNE